MSKRTRDEHKGPSGGFQNEKRQNLKHINHNHGNGCHLYNSVPDLARSFAVLSFSPIDITMESLFRPFGVLPDADHVSGDGKYAVFGVASAVAALTIFNFVSLSVAFGRNYKKIKKGEQKNNIFLLLGAQFGAIFGLISAAASTRSYPEQQPLYAQAFGYICFLTLGLLFLPALFLKPLTNSILKKKGFPAENIMIAVCVIFAIVGVALEVVVLVKDQQVPKALLYGIFSYKLIVVVAMMILGLYTIIATTKKVIDKANKRGDLVSNIAPASGIRITYLVFGIVSTLLYVIFDSFESPTALWMRGLEITSLFAAQVIAFFFSWSILRTLGAISFKKDGRNNQKGSDSDVILVDNQGDDEKLNH